MTWAYFSKKWFWVASQQYESNEENPDANQLTFIIYFTAKELNLM